MYKNHLSTIGITTIDKLAPKTIYRHQTTPKSISIKATCNSLETQKLLLESGIKIGLHTFNVEPYVRTPVQCKKCKEFGHSEKNCENHYSCSYCSGKHTEENCTSESPICANCKQDHSAYHRSCPVYKRLKDEALKRFYACQPQKSNIETVKRTYSSFVKPEYSVSQRNSIKEALDEQLNSIDNRINNTISKKTEESLSKFTNELKT
jgi:hypothetical protein